MEEVSGLSVKELRVFLRQRNLPTTGKKKDLLNRISQVMPPETLSNHSAAEIPIASKRISARKSKKPLADSQETAVDSFLETNGLAALAAFAGAKKEQRTRKRLFSDLVTVEGTDENEPPSADEVADSDNQDALLPMNDLRRNDGNRAFAIVDEDNAAMTTGEETSEKEALPEVENMSGRRSSKKRRSAKKLSSVSNDAMEVKEGETVAEEEKAREGGRQQAEEVGGMEGEAPARSPLPSSSRRSLKKKSTVNAEKRETASRLPRPPTSASSRGRASIREGFALAHAKIAAKQEDIASADARVKARHNEFMREGKRFERLATPKSATVAEAAPSLREKSAKAKKNGNVGVDFGVPADPSTLRFHFGGTPADFAAAAANRPVNTTPGRKIEKKANATEQRLGVKERTRNAFHSRPITLPMETTFINRLAAPSGGAVSTPSHRRVYTPHQGKPPAFIDTSKLTDIEFAVAVTEKIIPSNSVAASTAKRRVDAANLRAVQRQKIIDSIRLKTGKRA